MLVGVYSLAMVGTGRPDNRRGWVAQGKLRRVITAAADGSALSNPGPAGWAWYIDDERWARGGWPLGTNNMGELMAVLDLLHQSASSDEPLHVLCDSQYVINSITKWMPSWKRKGWKKADGKPVLNVELMQQLDSAMQGRVVTFEWVKGHSGHQMNEAADSLARGAATSYAAGEVPTPGPGFHSDESAAGAGPSAELPVVEEASSAGGELPFQDDLFAALDGSAPESETIVVSSRDIPARDELVALYGSVGWSSCAKDVKLLEKGLRGSLRLVTARFGGRLVGLARVVGDGATIVYLQDVLVHPDHQRTGLGRKLVDEVLRPFHGVRQIVLLVGAEEYQRKFCESLGFAELPGAGGEGLQGFVRFS